MTGGSTNRKGVLMKTRHLFIGATASAALMASALGSAFAWQAGGSSSASVNVGQNSAHVFLSPTGTYIGPDGAPAAHVADGIVQNTGNFALQVVSASVVLNLIDPRPPAYGDGPCLISHFTGSVTDLPAGPFGPPPPPAISQPPFKVKIAANSGAPNDCQGDNVHYTVTVNLTNP